MVIVDHKLCIRAVNAKYPGAQHDSHVWSVSSARKYFCDEYTHGGRNSRLLGDAGYPLETWLLTPYRNPDAGSQQSRFNQNHSKTRNIVERGIGILKNRFRCLLRMRGLHYFPGKAAQIFNVCCTLYNICIYYNVCNAECEPVLVNSSTEQENNMVQDFDSEARRIRDAIMQTM